MYLLWEDEVNSAYIIDGDKHVQASGENLQSIKFMINVNIVGVCCCVEGVAKFYYSDEYKMQIILNGNIAFDNTGEE
jgi:hypothetical protein